MPLSLALSQVLLNNFTEYTDLNELLSPELVADALSQTSVATIRKSNFPMEKMVWAVTGMELFRKYSMRQRVN